MDEATQAAYADLHLAYVDLQNEHDRLRGLLTERVAIDEIAVLTEDGPMCHCCGAMWEYDYDTTEVLQGTEWHNNDCWVLRVRAALGA